MIYVVFIQRYTETFRREKSARNKILFQVLGIIESKTVRGTVLAYAKNFKSEGAQK